MRLRIAVLCGALVLAVGFAHAAPATCDQTCTVIKLVLKDRSAAFANLKGDLKVKEDPDDTDQWNANLVMPRLDGCTIMGALDAPKGTNQYGCHLWNAPKERAQGEFATVVSALHAAAPNWKWFRDNDPRFPTAADSISLFAGPGPGKYFADIELTDQGAAYLLTLTITSKAHTTSLRVMPYSK